MFSGTGEVVRRWGREREAEQTVFQPLVSPLNKHLNVQLARQAEAVISFSPCQQHHVKFTVTHKLKEAHSSTGLTSRLEGDSAVILVS